MRLLVIERDGEVLLERRPALGIWGGLWSLPECAMEEDVEAALQVRFGIVGGAASAMPPLTHAFTHFRLTMHPVRVSMPARAARDKFDDLAWFTADAADAAGLPAPIRRLVRSLDLSGFQLQPLSA